MREPFPAHQISKLPKPTKAQTEEVKADYKKGIKCEICGAWHHPKVVHLDYVGHAALTDRLLEADPMWSWEPMSLTPEGLPLFDKSGGLWIRLTVCGVTRLGYGNAENSSFKDAGSREKEVIGDALRNAGMRFGAALDLWHKGDLHLDEEKEPEKQPQKPKDQEKPKQPDVPKKPETPKNFAPNDSSKIGIDKAVDLFKRASASGTWSRDQIQSYIKSVYKNEVPDITFAQAKEFLEISSKRTFDELASNEN